MRLKFAGSVFVATMIATAIASPQLAAQDVPQTIDPGPSGEGGGAFRLRDRVVPLPEDIELIKQGSAFMLAGKKDAATLVFKIKGGKIVYNVIGGSINNKKRAAIDAVVADMQRNLRD